MHKVTGDILLELKDVFYTHPDQSGAKNDPTLKDLTLSIVEGDSLSIIGPSGGGKSTLLRLLNRMTDPDSGSVLYHGKTLSEYDVLELRREILLVPQEPFITPGTVEDNLKLARRNNDVTPDEMHNVLASVGLTKKDLDLDSSRLSVGEKHRLALARAFLLEPKVLLLDEPAASLDLPGARGVIDTVRDLHEKYNNTIVMVTHRFRLARRLGGSVAMLVDGSIVETGDSIEIFRNPQTDEMKKFIEGGEED